MSRPMEMYRFGEERPVETKWELRFGYQGDKTELYSKIAQGVLTLIVTAALAYAWYADINLLIRWRAGALLGSTEQMFVMLSVYPIIPLMLANIIPAAMFTGYTGYEILKKSIALVEVPQKEPGA